MRDVVTGEAVVVDLPVAKLASRGLAFAVDLTVTGAAFGAVLLVLQLVGVLSTDPALAAAVLVGVGVLVFVGVPVTVETLTRGKSLGKLVMGLRVVRDDGGPVALRHALARGLAGLIVDFGVFSLFTGAVAVFASLASMRGKRVGDMLAGTVVVRERAPVSQRPAIGMPPELAGWARTLTLTGLSDAHAVRLRDFLHRAPDLDATVRATLGATLAAEVVALVSPPPPAGVSAEEVLAAVLAERGRREGERLAAVRVAPAASGPDGWALPDATPTAPPPPPRHDDGHWGTDTGTGSGRAPSPPSDGFALPR